MTSPKPKRPRTRPSCDCVSKCDAEDLALLLAAEARIART
jgi:hypothetical protein